MYKIKLLIKRFYNYTMDFLLLYGFLSIIISSYILWFILPMGQGMGGNKMCPNRLTGYGPIGNDTFVFGWPRYMWVDIHSWISIAVICLILIHLILHWRWLIETMKRFKDYILKQQKAVLERYIAALTLFVLTAFEVLSGCVLWLILPRGGGNMHPTQLGIGRTFWGLQRNVWVDLHAWVAVLMVAIIVVHVVIHWRWIVNVTLGKIKGMKNHGAVGQPVIQNIGQSQDGVKQKSYLPRAGMLIGVIGAICFLVAMLTFQLDWVNRYMFMLYLIPVPFICLILAKKYPLICGTLLILLGIAAIAFFFIFPVGIVWNQIGVWNQLSWETAYTVALVTMPLVTSGILFVLSVKSRERSTL
jgi:hypothetical protein